MGTGFLGFFKIAQNDNNNKITTMTTTTNSMTLNASFLSDETLNSLKKSLISIYFILEKLICVVLLIVLIIISLTLKEDLISNNSTNITKTHINNNNKLDYDYSSEFDKGKDEDTYNLEELLGEKEYPQEEKKQAKPASKFPPSSRSYSTLTRPKFYTMFSQCKYYSTQISPEVNDFIKSKNLNPVYIYDNLNEDLIQKNIKEDTKDLSGIYLILNKKTLSYYIGSASTNRLSTRFRNHLIHFTGSKILKNAVKKYELKNFSFMVLELFPEIVNQENNKRLIDLEDFYLKSLLPDYNILTEAGSSFGYKHSDITRIKMKTNYSEARRKQVGLINKGKNLSQEVIEKIRKTALLNRKNVVYSEEAILNMKKSSKAIILKELSGIVYAEYSSIVEATKSLNCSTKTIERSLNGSTKLLKKR
jgi:group I intron endonuclease